MTLQEAIRILKEHGYKYTGRRVDMLEFLAEEDRYLTASDILTKMRAIYPGISVDTVYRNLSLYTELGILEVTELDGEKHYRFICDVDHHHHFICLTCGKTKEIRICPMEELKKELEGYQIEDHKFEVYGFCHDCAV